VGDRERDFTFAAADASRTQALGEMVDSLGIVARDVEAAEQPWRAAAEQDRVSLLRRHLPEGRVLDVGSAAGGFLVAARDHYEAEGVEPDPGTSERARAAGLAVTTGTLESLDAPLGSFDAITMFHVVEHLDSPRAALSRTRELLRPGGVLVVETPTVDCLWFRVAPSRWRQLIPDHYWFFSQTTLSELLRQCGFEPVEHRKPGRRVSLRFAADRLRRAGVPGAAQVRRALALAGIEQRGVYLNPGDIMQLVSRAN
jgi:SAM-dependent methyltransferase